MQFPLTRNSRWNIRIFFQKTFFFQNVKSHIPSRILKPVVSIRYRNSWNKLNPNLKWVLNLVPKESHAAKSLQSCPTLCDPTDGSPPGPPRSWDSPGKNTGVGCHFLLQCMKVKSESEVAQSCPTCSDPMDWSPPGSSVHRIFQARVLEWGAIAFSKDSHREPIADTWHNEPPEISKIRGGRSYTFVPKKTSIITCFTSKICWSLKLHWMPTVDLR